MGGVWGKGKVGGAGGQEGVGTWIGMDQLFQKINLIKKKRVSSLNLKVFLKPPINQQDTTEERGRVEVGT